MLSATAGARASPSSPTTAGRHSRFTATSTRSAARSKSATARLGSTGAFSPASPAGSRCVRQPAAQRDAALAAAGAGDAAADPQRPRPARRRPRNAARLAAGSAAACAAPACPALVLCPVPARLLPPACSAASRSSNGTATAAAPLVLTSSSGSDPPASDAGRATARSARRQTASLLAPASSSNRRCCARCATCCRRAKPTCSPRRWLWQHPDVLSPVRRAASLPESWRRSRNTSSKFAELPPEQQEAAVGTDRRPPRRPARIGALAELATCRRLAPHEACRRRSARLVERWQHDIAGRRSNTPTRSPAAVAAPPRRPPERRQCSPTTRRWPRSGRSRSASGWPRRSTRTATRRPQQEAVPSSSSPSLPAIRIALQAAPARRRNCDSKC
jgi:hypothetical protein